MVSNPPFNLRYWYKPFAPIGRGTTLLRGLTNHGYEARILWDDSPIMHNLSNHVFLASQQLQKVVNFDLHPRKLT